VNVAGQVQKPKRDVYRERCDELSEEIHFEADDLFAWFGQLWMIRVVEQGWPKQLAKWQALRDVRESLDRRGMESD
jgi:hypothetical protein